MELRTVKQDRVRSRPRGGGLGTRSGPQFGLLSPLVTIARRKLVGGGTGGEAIQMWGLQLGWVVPPGE